MKSASDYIEKAFELLNEGYPDEAIDEFRSAIKLNPKNHMAYVGMGLAFQKNDYSIRQLAVGCFHKAIQLSPENAPRINCIIGNYYLKQHQPEQAWIFYQKAFQSAPDDPKVQFSLSDYYRYKSEFGKALLCLKKAELSGKVEKLKIHVHFAELYLRKKDLRKALAHIDQALSIEQGHIPSRQLKAYILLYLGRLKEGWAEFEFRQKYPNKFIDEKPLWDGSPLNGRIILVHWEMGFGDTFQFVRFLKMIQGGTVIFACHPKLKSLFQKLPGADIIIALGGTEKPEISFDCQIPLLSLPYIFGVTLKNLPPSVPYIFPDEFNVEYWKRKLQGNHYKIGIFWSGNQYFENNHNRQCPVEHFVDLTSMTGIRWYILQYPPVSLDAFAGNKNVDFLSNEIVSFADTAAIVQHLDLVITVDTGLAHLSGALGKPVWLLLAFVSGWRWLESGSKSPWYPTMTLFRQSKIGDWTEVFERVRKKLEERLPT